MVRRIQHGLVFGLVLIACRDQDHDYETEHLRIRLVGESPTPLCEGDLVYYEQQISIIESTLGRRLAPGVRVEMQDTFAGGVPRDGKYNDARRKITASRFSLVHELVHAVAADLGDPDEFFEEGAAVALDGTSRLFPQAVSLPSENVGIPGQPDYAVGGHFFRWLMARHGDRAAVDLLRGQSFESAIGAAIEEEEQEWMASAPWAYPPLDDCPYSALDETEDGWRGEVSLACEDPSVTTLDGDGDGIRQACRGFEISQAGLYDLETEGHGWLKRCLDGTVEQPQIIDADRVPNVEAGVYNLYPISQLTNPSFFELGRYAVCLQQLGEDPDLLVQIAIVPTGTTVVRP